MQHQTEHDYQKSECFPDVEAPPLRILFAEKLIQLGVRSEESLALLLGM